MKILIDADACPVKEETYKVARRCEVPVVVVSNVSMRVPSEEGISLVVVADAFDAADDWIVASCERADVVVTADLPLAARCLEKGAFVVGPKGREFTRASIGDALANRELSSHLREMGLQTGGPAPFGKKDRSRFLDTLDRVVQAARRA